MLSSCCRFSKARSITVMLKTMRMFTDIYDKGKAEENVYFLKEQKEKLRLLRKQMRELGRMLDENIKEIEKATKEQLEKKEEPKRKV